VRMGTEGQGAGIERYFTTLSERLRNVRVVCGDWKRVVSPAVLSNNKKLTGVLLDPPYTKGNQQYGAGGTGGDIANAVRLWAIANGDNKMLRIALCGLEGEHSMPAGWKRVKWHAGKGMSLSKEAMADRKLETIWFSPHCINNRLL
jgi:DNA adenine methylase